MPTHNCVTTRSNFIKPISMHFLNILSNTVKFHDSKPLSFENNLQVQPDTMVVHWYLVNAYNGTEPLRCRPIIVN